MLSLGETRPKPRQQAINSLLGNGCKCALKISRSSNDLVYKFNSECSRRRLCLLHEEDIRIATPAYNRDTAESRHGLLEQFQQLTTQFSGKARQPRNVSPWVGKAGDQPVSDWIGTARHHNRDGAGNFFSLETRTRTVCDDDVHLETDQLFCEIRQPITLAVRRSVFNGNVLSHYVAEIAQPLQKRLRRRRTSHSQVTDPRYFVGLLGLSGSTQGKEPSAQSESKALDSPATAYCLVPHGCSHLITLS